MPRLRDRWQCPKNPESVHPTASCAPWMRNGLAHAWMPGVRGGRDLTGRRFDMAKYGTVTVDARGSVVGGSYGGLRVGNASTYTSLPPQVSGIKYPLTAVWCGLFTVAPVSGNYYPDLFQLFGNNTDSNYVFGLQINGTNVVGCWNATTFTEQAASAWTLNRPYVITQRVTPTAMDLFVDGAKVGTQQTGTYTPGTVTSTAEMTLGAYNAWQQPQNTVTRYAALYTYALADDAVRLLSRDPMAGWRPRA